MSENESNIPIHMKLYIPGAYNGFRLRTPPFWVFLELRHSLRLQGDLMTNIKTTQRGVDIEQGT